MLSSTNGAHPPPRILSTATAVPPVEFDQAEVRERVRAIFASNGKDISHLLPVFENAGIRRRYSCVPLDWYARAVGWKERNDLYVRHALDLAETAASKALARANLQADEVDQVIALSTTGIATPSLDSRLIGRLGLRPDVVRLPVFGLGCAGGVLGLNRAAAMARAEPGSRVLMVVVELCALTFRPQDTSNSNVVAAALFGDGAAAAVISTEPVAATPAPSPAAAKLIAWGEHTWPDSLDVMGWDVEDDGLGVLFSRDIPMIVERDFAVAARDFLASLGLGLDDLNGAICHPGGAKVIVALERALGFAEGSMLHARQVLRDYGNMSAATVLFVLDRALEVGKDGRHLISALGPGFSVGFSLLEL
ncbi:MAG: type III polyketide synthase [Rhodovibrionaceae bacterium]|nr:type III polyketide synthase [Rhodovibrionaceae bacterium]